MVADTMAEGSVMLLREHGFRLLPLPNLFGIVDGLVAHRFIPGWVDSVMLRGEDCAVAARVRDVLDPYHPWRLGETCWTQVGEALDVVAGVTRQPIPMPDTTYVDLHWPAQEYANDG